MSAVTHEGHITNVQNLNLISVAKNIDLQIKIPLNPNLIRNFCNWKFRVLVEKGLLNLNKEYFIQGMRFFVYFDTLNNVLK